MNSWEGTVPCLFKKNDHPIKFFSALITQACVLTVLPRLQPGGRMERTDSKRESKYLSKHAPARKDFTGSYVGIHNVQNASGKANLQINPLSLQNQ